MSTKLGLIWTLWRKFASRIITPTDKVHFLKLDTEVPLFFLLPKRQPLLAAGNLWHPWHVDPAAFQASSRVFHFSLASNLKLTASPSIGETFFFLFVPPWDGTSVFPHTEPTLCHLLTVLANSSETGPISYFPHSVDQVSVPETTWRRKNLFWLTFEGTVHHGWADVLVRATTAMAARTWSRLSQFICRQEPEREDH